jgi:hypothetical protein
MSSFKVLTPALAAAAIEIELSGRFVTSAGAAVTPGQQGAFGSEPIGAAFADMSTRAQEATTELEHTVQMLSRNVAAAAIGYLVTDQGIAAISELHRYGGFKP